MANSSRNIILVMANNSRNIILVMANNSRNIIEGNGKLLQRNHVGNYGKLGPTPKDIIEGIGTLLRKYHIFLEGVGKLLQRYLDKNMLFFLNTHLFHVAWRTG